MDAVGLLGRRAAEQGISAGRVVQLYLSAARRLWQDLPMVVRSRDRDAVRAAATAVLQVVDDAVATLAEGYAVARRDLVRREETLRRELIDDLLRGDSDLGALVERAEPFGLDLARVHQVALAAPSRRLPDADAAISALEAVMFDRLGDRDVLVATKDGLLVVLAPAEAAAAGRISPALEASNELGRLMHRELSRLPRGRPWRVAVGRAHPGLYGIARSYEEAREALTMAGRLHVDSPVVNAHDLLVYRVVLRDQPAIVDLVHAVLSPLAQARGGAGPLLATLDAYFATGGGGHRVGETAARVGAHRHLPPGPGQGADRLQPGRPRTPVHAAGGGARRQGPQLAAGAAAHPRLIRLMSGARPVHRQGTSPAATAVDADRSGRPVVCCRHDGGVIAEDRQAGTSRFAGRDQCRSPRRRGNVCGNAAARVAATTGQDPAVLNVRCTILRPERCTHAVSADP